MVEMLKNMRAYLIYNGFIFLFLLVGYVLMPGRFVGQDCDWIWLWLVVAYWVSMFSGGKGWSYGGLDRKSVV